MLGLKLNHVSKRGHMCHGTVSYAEHSLNRCHFEGDYSCVCYCTLCFGNCAEQFPVGASTFTARDFYNFISTYTMYVPTKYTNSQYVQFAYYNMVGVAVAMVISTMHEKSCIDSHNARKFEQSSKIQSFTHLAITIMKLRTYHSHEFLKVS